ncbi:hypothetical protein AB0953_20925 [Streptomyces sp. NPDC046866]|uniref:hypothetical protein n=1 Tax=Streptomyces sp. NPDC046866 TaxID=3154921 RepID=UPI0034533632
MDVPVAARWLLLALALVQLVVSAGELRRVLRAEPGERTDRWLAFADRVVGVPACTALAFGWLDLFLYVMVVAGPVMAWRLARNLRTRRREPSHPL